MPNDDYPMRLLADELPYDEFQGYPVESEFDSLGEFGFGNEHDEGAALSQVVPQILH